MATKVTKLVVHHSASAGKSTNKALIEKWHKERGFSQIGYHRVIEANGSIVQGRSEETMGAHAKGANSGSLGVCVVGNFESEIPSAGQLRALISQLTSWCRKYGLNQDNIYGHFNVPGVTTATLCPGKNLKSKLSSIKQSIKQRLNLKLYAVEANIKDPSIRKAVRKALVGDQRFSYEDTKLILKSTLDGKGVTKQELRDVQIILRQSKTLDSRSKNLINNFLKNPKVARAL